MNSTVNGVNGLSEKNGLAEGKLEFKEILRRYNVFFTLVLMSIIAAIVTQGLFFQSSNLLNVGERASIVGIVALGQTLVILSGGIDLSVGAMVSIALTIMAKTVEIGGSQETGIILAVIACMVVGLINGLIISNTKVPPFMVTMGTMLIVQSSAMYITGAGQLRFEKLQDAVNSTFHLTNTGSRLLPTGFWIILSLIAIFLLARSRYGMNVFAVGGKERAAGLSGVKTSNMKIMVYTCSGLFAALAAFMLAYRLGGANPDAGVPFQLESIAAVILGGTNILGGEGSVFGSMLGAIVMAIIVNLMNLLKVDPFIQDAIKGLILVAFIFNVNVLSKRSS